VWRFQPSQCIFLITLLLLSVRRFLPLAAHFYAVVVSVTGNLSKLNRVLILLLAVGAQAQQMDSTFFAPMQWRLIGPFRAGRVTSVAGVPSEPNVYYFGTPGGGVWKSIDGGRVWKPIFDQQRVPGIGSVAVAPSNPQTIYVGTGEGGAGNGVYRSLDDGATWVHAGLEKTRYIPALVVDPKNPDIAIAGANSLGHAIIWRPIPKSAYQIERGIFKTLDGGKTWNKVLSKDDTVGVVDLCADPNDPSVLYAALYRPASGAGDKEIKATSELFKSTDEGSTWQPLSTKGLPEKDRGRVGVAVVGRRLYAILDQGMYRSDDGGASWQQSTKDPRILGSEYFSRVFADPTNPDTLYVAQTSLYRSTDGGHTFEPYVGAPSGDDFHVLWINPRDSRRMLLGVDQGAIVTVNGGQTWSSWYNQPTGEFYHVSTDTAFPYHVYGAQQDSGTAAVASRSDNGQIGDRDWMSVGGFEFCFISPDPLNPNLVYSGGWYGTVVRFDKTTGQLATIFERGDKYRAANMAPLAFAPLDPHTLYLGTQFVMKTSDAGATWQTLSPDLTKYVEKDPDAKRDPDQPPPPAITALALSPLRAGVIWAGASNRVVQVTRNGGASWRDVTPPGLTEPSRILSIEASHYDPGTAYVVVGGSRETTPPYIARTRDYGATWQTIVQGLPEGDMARVVREDPVRRGLLYAGTETGVFVSVDDGAHWRTLQLNLPVAIVTDLDVHGNDLVASTYGRAMWILDDLTPIRAFAAEALPFNSSLYLIPPAPAMRVRWDNFQDTPEPPETPAGQNPPDGAIIDYLLKSAPAGEITLTISDDSGQLVRQFSSQPKAPDLPLPNVPSYWFGPLEALTKAAGLNRFVWDLRYPPPVSLPYGYYGNLIEYTEYTLADHAIPERTPRQQPQGPLVVPGTYTVQLSGAGASYSQKLTVTLDPRLKVSSADLQQQLDLEQQIARGMSSSYHAYEDVAALRHSLSDRKKELPEAAAALEKKIDAVDKGTRTAPGFGPVNRDLTRLASSVQSADVRPAETAIAAVAEKCKALDEDLAKWRKLNEQDILEFNASMPGAHLPIATVAAKPGCAR
jgi:photosystem II stability/assembly factor-like uncharacterized protein